jgi:hypothetical protein
LPRDLVPARALVHPGDQQPSRKAFRQQVDGIADPLRAPCESHDPIGGGTRIALGPVEREQEGRKAGQAHERDRRCGGRDEQEPAPSHVLLRRDSAAPAESGVGHRGRLQGRPLRKSGTMLEGYCRLRLSGGNPPATFRLRKANHVQLSER